MYTVYFDLFNINALLQIMIGFMQLLIVLDSKALWLQIVQSQIFE